MKFSSVIRPHNWSISVKITTFSLVIALGSLSVMGIMQSRSITDAVIERQSVTLESVVHERSGRVEGTFNFVKDQISGMSLDETIVQASKDFNSSFDQLSSYAVGEKDEMYSNLSQFYDREFKPRLNAADQPYRGSSTYVPASVAGQAAQTLYIVDNPTAVGSKLDYLRAPEDLAYNTHHGSYHKLLKRYLDILAAYDIFIVNNSGDIVYSVYKETDYATNLLNGPYAQTNLGDAFRASTSGTSGVVSTTDFDFYEPSYGASAIFFSAPIMDGGMQIGVICAQLPLQSIFDSVLKEPIGETGITHLIGADRTIRSVLPDTEDSMLTTVLESDAAHESMKGEAGRHIGVDDNGTNSLAVFQPLDLEGMDWIIFSNIDLAEVVAPAKAMQKALIFQSFGSAAVIIILSLLFAKSLSKPIHSLVSHISKLESGDFSHQISLNRTDEIGQLGASMDDMSSQIGKMISEVSGCASEVAGAATEIAASSEEMASGLETQETRTNDVSAAIEEMSASVISISDQSVEAASATENAGVQAKDGGLVVSDTVSEIELIAVQVQHAVESVTQLGEKSEQIGEIISVIDEIADQTNLLALNAAIEAARAGEHGRGFAVVADEVRKLAERTQQATEQVSVSIREIQSDTKNAIARITEGANSVENGVQKATLAGESLDRIMDTSQGLKNIVDSIASAVDQQKMGTQLISEATSGIADVTRESAISATQASEAAANLSEQSERLLSLTSRFHI
jgi:methyl-accepting chemotaxis protein